MINCLTRAFPDDNLDALRSGDVDAVDALADLRSKLDEISDQVSYVAGFPAISTVELRRLCEKYRRDIAVLLTWSAATLRSELVTYGTSAAHKAGAVVARKRVAEALGLEVDSDSERGFLNDKFQIASEQRLARVLIDLLDLEKLNIDSHGTVNFNKGAAATILSRLFESAHRLTTCIGRNDKCAECNGSGTRISAEMGIVDGWTILRRCDSCALFLDDLHAAHENYKEIRTAELNGDTVVTVRLASKR